MKVVCIADQHGHFDQEVPDCDLLVLAGDQGFNQSTAADFYWWLEDAPATDVVIIGGNLDFTLYDLGYPAFCRGTYLENSGVEYQGKVIWGTPWVPNFAGRWTDDEQQLSMHYDLVPDDCNILVVHGPPYGVLDVPGHDPKGSRHVGSKALLKRIEDVQPELVVCGHIHGSYGEDDIGSTHVVNAAVADGQEPIVVNL